MSRSLGNRLTPNFLKTSNQKKAKEKEQNEQNMKNYLKKINDHELSKKYQNFISNKNKYNNEKYNEKLMNFIDTEKVGKLVKIKRLINKVDKDGISILMYTILNKQNEKTKLLIENNADVNIVDKDGNSALMYAIGQENNFEICKLLIENGANINLQNNSGKTPLMESITAYKIYPTFDISIFKLLIENGANINMQDKNGRTALIYALTNKNNEIFSLLIDRGADLNIKDKEGKNILMYAIGLENNFEICKLLIDKGIIITNTDINTFLVNIIYEINSTNKINNRRRNNMKKYKSNSINNYLNIIKILIENYINLNVNVKDVNNPLLLAFNLKYYFICKLLIDKGFKITNTNMDKFLREGIRDNNTEIVKLLIDLIKNNKNTNFNVKDEDTYLLLAFKGWNNTEICELLIDNGFKIKDKNKILMEMMNIYLKQNNNFFRDQIRDKIKILIKNGADINVKDANTFLINMINSYNLEMCKLLIENKSTDLNLQDEEGNTPLMISLKKRNDNFFINKNNYEISKLLIESRSDLDLQNNNGETALMIAINTYDYKISELLIDKCKINNLELKNKNGKTALILAIQKEMAEICELLKKKGLKLNSESKRTAKKFAKNIPDKTSGTDERKYKINDLLDEW